MDVEKIALVAAYVTLVVVYTAGVAVVAYAAGYRRARGSLKRRLEAVGSRMADEV